jgi:hypothetical protein
MWVGVAMDGSYLSSSGDEWKYCGVGACCVVMALTEGIHQALKNGAAALKGHARRVFMARAVRDFGPRGQRLAERQLGWNRRTIRKGEHELRSGVECVAAFNARGRKPIDARLPNLRADIKDLIDSQSQTDPRFESERVYCRLSASNVVELLIDRKGYTDLQLPSNETIRNIINAEGYELRKVQKTKPQKKSRKPTRSSSRSTM